MYMAGINTSIDAIGGLGGYGGFGGFGGFGGGYGMGGFGSGDFLLGALIGGGNLFGGRNDCCHDHCCDNGHNYIYKEKDNCCCCSPATCEQVNGVDRDVLQSANETQDDICEATNTIKDAIGIVGDKVTSGNYALANKMSDLAYLQQATAKDTQVLIEKGNTAIIAAIKETSLKERNQYLEDQLEKERECKLIQKIECACGRGRRNGNGNGGDDD